MTAPVTNNTPVMNRFSYFKNNQPGSYNQNAVLNPNISNNQISADSPLNMSPLNPYISQNSQQVPFNGVVIDRLALHKVEYAAYAGVALSAAALLVALFNRGKVKGVSKSVKAMGEEVQKITQSNNKIEEKHTLLDKMTGQAQQLIDRLTTAVSGAETLQSGLKATAVQIYSIFDHIKEIRTSLSSQLTGRYIETPLPASLPSTLMTESAKRMQKHDLHKLGKNTTAVWVTSEHKYVDAGGLGKVPVELCETFNSVVQVFKAKGKGYIYGPLYKHKPYNTNAKIQIEFNKLENGSYLYNTYKTKGEFIKLDSFNLKIYEEGGTWHNELIDVYIEKDAANNKVPHILFDSPNSEYFNITEDDPSKIGIYSSNSSVIEPERFAFMSKVIHEFTCNLLKMKEEGKVLLSDGRKGFISENIIELPDGQKLAINELKEKGLFIVKPMEALAANDWQSGALVGLIRYMTYLKDLPFNTAAKFADINIEYVVHNGDYSGFVERDKKVDEALNNKILRLLYEKFLNGVPTSNNGSNGIKSSATSWKKLTDKNEKMASTLYYDYKVVGAQTGLTLADEVRAVSTWYAEELAKIWEIGHAFVSAHELRKLEGTFEGITNGSNKIKLIPQEKLINKANEKLGLNLKLYDENTVSAEIKAHNAKEMIGYLNKVISEAKKGNNIIKDVSLMKPELTDLSGVDEKTPVYALLGRWVDQKGIDILTESIKKLYTELETKQKQKPVFIIAGQPASGKEGEKLVNMLEAFKQSLGEKGNRVVALNGFAPHEVKILLETSPNFFNVPSWFAPCELTDIEAMAKGTIPIVTKTGGLQKVKDGETGFVTKIFSYKPDGNGAEEKFRTALETNSQSYYEELKRAYDLFVDKPEEYMEMVKRAMKTDFSWILGAPKDKKGLPVEDYEWLLNIDPKNYKGSFWAHMKALGIDFSID